MDSRYEAVETVSCSTIKYMEELEAELSSMPGYKKPENIETVKESLKSRTDPECGYIHQARKRGLGYLIEMTVDTNHGIITGVDCYPANQRESDIILGHLKKQLCEYQEIGLDGGYDIEAVYRGLELLGSMVILLYGNRRCKEPDLPIFLWDFRKTYAKVKLEKKVGCQHLQLFL